MNCPKSDLYIVPFDRFVGQVIGRSDLSAQLYPLRRIDGPVAERRNHLKTAERGFILPLLRGDISVYQLFLFEYRIYRIKNCRLSILQKTDGRQQ